MKKLLSISLLFSLIFSDVFAQDSKEFAEENDPEAYKVFEKIREKYDEYQSMKVEFSMEIEIPEQAPIKQSGVLFQKQEKYRLELPEQLHISDGEQLWLYLKEKNQVQLHALGDDEDGIITPKDLLRFYERDDFLYALTNEFFDKKRVIQQIELKPTERTGDISKFKVEVDKKTAEILSIKAFFLDGVRYSVFLDKVTPSPSELPVFTFNKKDYPDVEVEDLRID